MKKIYVFLLVALFLIPLKVSATGSFNVSNSSINMHIGETKTINITSDNSVGKLNISSSNTGIASTNISTTFIQTPGASNNMIITANSVGSVTISIVATSDYGTMDEEPLEGLTKTINVNVVATPQVSSNANLSSLSLSSGALSPNFSSYQTTYMKSTYNDTETILATAEDSSSRISGTGIKNLSFGENKFTITVTAADGTTKNYYLIITRNKKPESTTNPNNTNTTTNTTPIENKNDSTKSSINTLKSLEIEGKNIKFKSSTLAYSETFENNVEEVEIKAEATDAKSQIEGIGKQKLNVGSNVLKVIVTAENGDKKTYSLTFIRKDENGTTSGLSSVNSLKTLEIKGYNIGFDKNKTKYVLDVDETVKEINVIANAENEKATITGAGIIQLKDKVNNVNLIVTAENGDKKSYLITVNKGKEQINKKNSFLIPIIIIIGSGLALAGFVLKKKRDNINNDVSEETYGDIPLVNEMTNINNNLSNVSEKNFNATLEINTPLNTEVKDTNIDTPEWPENNIKKSNIQNKIEESLEKNDDAEILDFN